MKNFTACLAVALLAGACASNEAKKPATADSTPPRSTSASQASSATPAAGSNVAGNPLTDPHNILSKRSVYFDFDSDLVKDQYRDLIRAHARYLVEHPQARMRIEGNTDERGSREYNLALGERRAEAVKKVMTVLGVPGNHIETVSYGEEKPVASGHDEASWAKNRRDDMKYAGS